MATLIKFKRRNESKQDSEAVTLQQGEPFYDVTKKQFFVGNNDNETIDKSKMHIAQITPIELDTPGKIAFQIGEDPNNKFEKTIEQQEISKVEESEKASSVVWTKFPSKET